MNARGLERRVEFWRRRILPEWRVAIMGYPPPDPPEGDWIAVVETDTRIFEARVHFKVELLERERAEIDRVIVHELVHVPLDPVLDLDSLLEPHVPQEVLEAYREARYVPLEQAVDRLAHLIADGHNDRPIYRTRTITG